MSKNKTITKKQVEHLAKLASLELTSEEINKYQSDLDEIMDFMNQIKNLDLKSIEETSRTTDEENVLRNDEVIPSLTQEEALSNAKKTHKGFFLVPHVLVGKES
jgi:aspartyl-tRNA(Asn)/glutamyl-tRNA(Gln) amidotransferase subunit C